MSKRFDVGVAVKALVKAALPNSKVLGMEPDEAKPSNVDDFGLVIVRSGDPGTPDVDLSPPTYWYEHQFPIEIAARSREQLDTMMTAIGDAIVADRFLGGLCIYLDAQAPVDGETQSVGVAAMSWADFPIIATYSTTSPLG